MIELEKLTRPDLMDMLDQLGVKYTERWSKQKLIEEVEKHSPNPAPKELTRSEVFLMLRQKFELERKKRASKGDASARRFAKAIKELIRLERILP